MKKFLAFVVLSSILTFAVIALADATVLQAAPQPERALPESHAPLLELTPVTLT